LLDADRAILAEAFASGLDPAMSSYGFTSRDGSLIYRRAEAAADEVINTGVARHPYYHRTAWFDLPLKLEKRSNELLDRVYDARVSEVIGPSRASGARGPGRFGPLHR
jgi:hypothetical protein